MIKYKFLLFLTALILSACAKHKVPLPASTYSVAPVFPGFGGVPVDNKEYFWKYSWQKDSVNSYQMIVNTWRLTDSAINRGVRVYVAIYTDWSPFERVPQTLHDVFLPDTINLTYKVTAGHLNVFAKAPFQIEWPSDIMIEYQ